QHTLGQGNPFVNFPGISKLAGQHQLGIAIGVFVLRSSGDGFAGRSGGLVVFVRIAISVNNVLIAAQCVIAAHIGHLLIGSNGLVRLALLAIHIGQTVEEDRAIVLFAFRVLAGHMLGVSDQLFENLRCLIVLSKRVVGQRFIEIDFERIGGEVPGLLQRSQRLIVFTLVAFDFGNAKQ